MAAMSMGMGPPGMRQSNAAELLDKTDRELNGLDAL